MSNPVFYIKDASLFFGEKTIFEELECYIYKGDKICLIGNNGAGKSSLLKVISGLNDVSNGDIFINKNITIHYMHQEIIKYDGKVIDYLLNECNAIEYEIEYISEKLNIDINKNISELSGGLKRRVLIAESILKKPDILLLDEPTNHLDILTIEWLEGYINSYNGAVICISHDRKFLDNISNKTWWIYKNKIYKSNTGYKKFDEFQEQIFKEEENIIQKLNKKLLQENEWLSKGVTARRKRNQRRLKDLISLRTKLKNQSKNYSIKQYFDDSEIKKSNFIIETKNLSFAIDNKYIIKDCSIKFKKNEKIGIVGPNGSGKTTLIKLLLKILPQTSGSVKLAKHLNITYFDQERTEIDRNISIRKFLSPQGNDYINVNYSNMHIGSYLKKMGFNPKIIDDKVSTLSGGESSRLLMAYKLIKPADILVLDEPTNDLDIDTLDYLLDLINDHKGTVFIVSHDRDFLENIVTRTLIIKNKEVIDIFGGYEDYKIYLKNDNNTKTETNKKNLSVNNNNNLKENNNKNNKLSYKHKRLLDLLPKEIEELEKEIELLNQELSEKDLFKKNRERFDLLSKKLEKKQLSLDNKLEEWCDIEELQTKLNKN